MSDSLFDDDDTGAFVVDDEYVYTTLRAKSKQMAAASGLIWLGVLHNPATGGYLGAAVATQDILDGELAALERDLHTGVLGDVSYGVLFPLLTSLFTQ